VELRVSDAAMNRRTLLALAGVAGVAGCGRLSDGPGTGRLLTSKVVPARFRTPLPIPATARPVRVTADADHYVLTQKAADVDLVPGRKTRIWGYDGTFPGPTLRARTGRPMVVTMRNELPVPTSTHLHGGVNPPDSDGFPTDLTVPRGYSPAPPGSHGGHVHEASRDYHYPNGQRAATLWYHDHRMDFTGPQVWRGLLGLFLVTDPREEALPLPRDERDLPLIICDRAFDGDGSFAYPSTDTAMHAPGARGQFVTGVFGDVILVNGAPWPRHEVDAARYRLRLVNASNARRYRLGLRAPGGQRLSMIQIGSDDGLLPAAVSHDEIIVTPGERYDVVVDFAGLPIGAEVTLVNDFGTGATGEVMRFVVVRKTADDTHVPDRLSTVDQLARTDAVAERQFDFRYDEGRWTVNRQLYDPAGSLAAPRLDTVELWRFTSDFHHPVHIHLAHFQVLSRAGQAPDPWESGWKDTVDVRPYETVEVLAKFAGHRGKYMLHCHNLEHEDMAMMANFDVV
jgi:spore coat protein A